MATDLHTYTEKGFTLSNNRELKPRTRSGIVGEITANFQFGVAETAQILAAIKSTAVSKEDRERDLLAHFGIKRESVETAKADTTDTLQQEINAAVLAAIKAGKTAQEIAEKMRARGLTEAQIVAALPELAKKPKAEKLSFI